MQDLKINSNTTDDGSDPVQDMLLRLDIKPTSQRVEIARVLLRKPQHLSAEQVLSLVNADRGLVSKATVYNTLSLFVEKGLVKQVIIDPARVFYDSNTHSHYHFFNEDTGELSDFSSRDMMIEPMPVLPENTTKSGVDIIIRVKNSS